LVSYCKGLSWRAPDRGCARHLCCRSSIAISLVIENYHADIRISLSCFLSIARGPLFFQPFPIRGGMGDFPFSFPVPTCQ